MIGLGVLPVLVDELNLLEDASFPREKWTLLCFLLPYRNNHFSPGVVYG